MFKPVLTEEDKEDIREARKEGKSYNAISKTIDASRGTITRFCILEGITVDVSEKVIKANQIKGELFGRKKEICAVCKKEYKPRCDSRVPCCSRKCAGIYRRIGKKCRECGERCKDLRYKPYCSKECYYESHIMKCVDCGVSFQREYRSSLIRCKKCRKEYLKLKWRRYYHKNEEKMRKKAEIYNFRNHKLKTEIVLCLECGKRRYVTKKQKEMFRYCGPKCSAHAQNRRHKMRKKKAFVEEVSYNVIYERDNGRCQICGRQVHKRWNPHDKLSGTMDHIIALANDGEHSYDNIQLACLYCNVKKSDKKTWLQQELVGA